METTQTSQTLQKLQKRAARVITNRSVSLFNNLKWEPIEAILKGNIAIMYTKYCGIMTFWVMSTEFAELRVIAKLL